VQVADFHVIELALNSMNSNSFISKMDNGKNGLRNLRIHNVHSWADADILNDNYIMREVSTFFINSFDLE